MKRGKKRKNQEHVVAQFHKVAPLTQLQCRVLRGGVGRTFYSWQARRSKHPPVFTELYSTPPHKYKSAACAVRGSWPNVDVVLCGGGGHKGLR